MLHNHGALFVTWVFLHVAVFIHDVNRVNHRRVDSGFSGDRSLRSGRYPPMATGRDLNGGLGQPMCSSN